MHKIIIGYFVNYLPTPQGLTRTTWSVSIFTETLVVSCAIQASGNWSGSVRLGRGDKYTGTHHVASGLLSSPSMYFLYKNVMAKWINWSLGFLTNSTLGCIIILNTWVICKTLELGADTVNTGNPAFLVQESIITLTVVGSSEEISGELFRLSCNCS